MLDSEEFALAMHLIRLDVHIMTFLLNSSSFRIKTEGHDIPDSLPPHLIPPSKKNHDIFM